MIGLGIFELLIVGAAVFFVVSLTRRGRSWGVLPIIGMMGMTLAALAVLSVFLGLGFFALHRDARVDVHPHPQRAPWDNSDRPWQFPPSSYADSTGARVRPTESGIDTEMRLRRERVRAAVEAWSEPSVAPERASAPTGPISASATSQASTDRVVLGRLAGVPLGAEATNVEQAEAPETPTGAPAVESEPKADAKAAADAPQSLEAERPPEPVPAERAVVQEPPVPLAPAEQPIAVESLAAQAATTADIARPAWVGKPLGKQPRGPYQEQVATLPYTTVEECDEELQQLIAERVQHYVGRRIDHAAAAELPINSDYIWKYIVKEQWTEDDVESSVGPMVRVHALLEYDDDVNAAVRMAWDRHRSQNRLFYVGGVAALIMGLIGTVFGYLRLDTLTRGYYTRRLQVTAGAAILALLAGLVNVLRMI